MLELLKRYFGYDRFRPLQAEIMDAVMGGRDALVVMPTGGGKSLCYQLPALALPGITLVVSPLIALMKDQVDALKANGVPAECLNSGMSGEEQSRVQMQTHRGEIKLLYVAPERIVRPGFQRFLETLELSLIAVDEAHCISQWGHEFRPDYRNLRQLRQISPETPVIALTATATRRVRDDIVVQLAMKSPSVFSGSINRPNLRYAVFPNTGKYDTLVGHLRGRNESSAIIYRGSQKGCDELAADLAEEGFRSLSYHAGLGSEIRQRNQERFVRDEADVIVATVAFGMGIDKPDIRLVAHYDMPGSVERYYQESGRAGRDGLPSDCIVFYGAQDREREMFFIERMENDLERQSAEAKLDAMVGYCQTGACRRAALLRYFGEEPSEESCDSCDVCQAETFDATVISQKILSAVIRTGERFGATHVSQVLTGRRVKSVLEREHDSLSVFGIVNDYTAKSLREIMATLVNRGLLERSGSQYPTLFVTTQGRHFLKQRESIELPVLESTKQVSYRKRTELEYDNDLFQKLRELRTKLAADRGVPPYVVFGDVSLREMAHYYPQSRDSLLKINGVGRVKLNDFGDDFLDLVRDYAEPRSIQDRTAPESHDHRSESRRSSNGNTSRHSGTGSSLQKTLALLREGIPFEEVVDRRGLAESTISSHIEWLIESGELEDYDRYLPAESDMKRITQAFDTLGDGRLRPVHEYLRGEYAYWKIRLVRSHLRRQPTATSETS